jgi:two-component system, LuxR family, sensor kinase FixL
MFGTEHVGLNSQSKEGLVRGGATANGSVSLFNLLGGTVILYLAAQWLALFATIQPANISLFWPHGGVILAVFVLLPRSKWWVAALLIFVLAIGANLIVGRSLSSSTLLSVNDVFVGLVGVSIYRRLGIDQRPTDNIKAFGKFLVVVGFSSIISATLGSIVIHEIYGSVLIDVWFIWLSAMCLGILVVAPTLILMSSWSWRNAIGAVSSEVMYGFVACAFLLLTGYGNLFHAAPVILLSWLFLVVILIWSAIRFDEYVASLLLAAVTCIEALMTARGAGPLSLLKEPLSVMATWVLAVFILRAVTILLLVADKFRQTQLENVKNEQSARLESIVSTSPDAIVSITEKGIVETFSLSAQRLFGYSESEVIGQNIKMLMPEYYRERHDGYLERYRETGERRIIGIGRLVSGQRKDGSTFPMELSVGEALSSSGRSFIGFIRDVTERQETELRMHELQDELIHVSRVSAMGELASALAHELNQPLTAIKNYSQAGKMMFESKSRHDELPSILAKVIDQAERAGQIIRKLRAFVSAKQLEVQAEDVDQIIEEACALALIGAREEGIRNQIERNDRTTPRVMVDRVQIQQVLVNLIRNAVDAMRGSENRELRIRTTFADHMVQIAVIDTGHGVSEGAKANLFKPFITTKTHGMGVGLSISRTIAEAHGGKLHYDANPIGGAIFTLTLPVLEQDGQI